MIPDNFVDKEFFADNWELEVKNYIGSISHHNNKLWFDQTRENRKIWKELISLGYYVKYRFGQNHDISFKLNTNEGKEDGWIYTEGMLVESVQIVIAYYDEAETKENNKFILGDQIDAKWVIDRIDELSVRIYQRINKKIAKNYENISILLVGVNDWFIKEIDEEYKKIKVELVNTIESLIVKSQFREIAIVDADLIGNGALLRINNPKFHE